MTIYSLSVVFSIINGLKNCMYVKMHGCNVLQGPCLILAFFSAGRFPYGVELSVTFIVYLMLFFFVLP